MRSILALLVGFVGGYYVTRGVLSHRDRVRDSGSLADLEVGLAHDTPFYDALVCEQIEMHEGWR